MVVRFMLIASSLLLANLGVAPAAQAQDSGMIGRIDKLTQEIEKLSTTIKEQSAQIKTLEEYKARVTTLEAQSAQIATLQSRLNEAERKQALDVTTTGAGVLGRNSGDPTGVDWGRAECPDGQYMSGAHFWGSNGRYCQGCFHGARVVCKPFRR